MLIGFADEVAIWLKSSTSYGVMVRTKIFADMYPALPEFSFFLFFSPGKHSLPTPPNQPGLAAVPFL